MSESVATQRGAVAGTVTFVQHDLRDALAISSRLARRSGASTLSPSGNRVWIIPSRVSWLEGAYWVMVTSDAPDFTPHPDFRLERFETYDALAIRLILGKLHVDAPIWTPEYLSEPERREEPVRVMVSAPEVPAKPERYESVTMPLAETSK